MKTLEAISSLGAFAIGIAIIIAVAAFTLLALLYRPEIRALIARTQRLGGLVLSPDPGRQQLTDLPQPEAISVPPVGTHISPHVRLSLDQNATLRYFYRAVEADIVKYGLNNNETLVDLLKFSLAKTLAIATFEGVGRIIFGTQIGALRVLGGKIDGQTLNQLKDHYEEHVKRATAAGLPPLDQFAWINFLRNQNLIVFNNDQYSISDIGRGFLEWTRSVSVDEKSKCL